MSQEVILFIISVVILAIAASYMAYLLNDPVHQLRPAQSGFDLRPITPENDEPVFYKLAELPHQMLAERIQFAAQEQRFKTHEEALFVWGVIDMMSTGMDVESAIVEMKFSMITMNVEE